MELRIFSIILAMFVVQVFAVDYKAIVNDLNSRVVVAIDNVNQLRASLNSFIMNIDGTSLNIATSDGKFPLQDKLDSLKQEKDFSRCSPVYDQRVQSLNKQLQTTVKYRMVTHEAQLADLTKKLTNIKNILSNGLINNEIIKCNDPKEQSCPLIQSAGADIKNAEELVLVQSPYITPPGLPQRIITRLDPMQKAQIIQQSIIDPVNNCLSHAPM